MGTLKLCLELTRATEKEFFNFELCSQRKRPKCENFSSKFKSGRIFNLLPVFSGYIVLNEKILFPNLEYPHDYTWRQKFFHGIKGY